MKIELPTHVTGTPETVVLLELQLPAPAEREVAVSVETGGPLEPQDLRARGEGGTYAFATGHQALHIPLRVTEEGAGEAEVTVRWSDETGRERTESRRVTLEGAAEPAVSSRSGGAGKMALTGLLVGGLAAGALFWKWDKPVMPDVLARTLAEAEPMLDEAGIEYTTEFVQVQNASADGRVQSTFPAEAHEVSGKAVLKIGRYEVILGNYVDLTEAEARAALEQANLFATIRLEDVEDEADVGKVIGQRPSSTTALKPQEEVVLTVGRRAEPLAPEPFTPATPPAGTPTEPTGPVIAEGPNEEAPTGAAPNEALPEEGMPEEGAGPGATDPLQPGAGDPRGDDPAVTAPGGPTEEGTAEMGESTEPAGTTDETDTPTDPGSVVPPAGPGANDAAGTGTANDPRTPDAGVRDDGSRVNPLAPIPVPEGDTTLPSGTPNPGTPTERDPATAPIDTTPGSGTSPEPEGLEDTTWDPPLEPGRTPSGGTESTEPPARPGTRERTVADGTPDNPGRPGATESGANEPGRSPAGATPNEPGRTQPGSVGPKPAETAQPEPTNRTDANPETAPTNPESTGEGTKPAETQPRAVPPPTHTGEVSGARRGEGAGGVPSVVGNTRDAAYSALRKAGLRVRVRYADEGEAGTPGSVVRQAPAAGGTLQPGQRVTIFVVAAQ